MGLRAANDFVEKHHRHSARTAADGGKFAIGLEHEGKIIGVGIVGRPVARLLNDNMTAELLRCCVSPTAPKGSTSKLYSRCKRIWQLMGGIKFVTYTLKRESGASMRGAGLKEPAAEVAQQQWTRTNRPRKERAIYEESKVRWQEDLPLIPIGDHSR